MFRNLQQFGQSLVNLEATNMKLALIFLILNFIGLNGQTIDDDELPDKVTDIWNRLAELIKKVEIIDQFDKQHSRQMKEAVDKIRSLQEDVNSLKSSASKIVDDDLDFLRAQNQLFQDRLVMADEKVEKLEENHAKLTSTIREISSKQSTGSDNVQLIQRIEAVEGRNKKLEEQMNVIQTKMNNLERKNSVLEDQLKSVEREVTVLGVKNAKLMDQLNSSPVKLQSTTQVPVRPTTQPPVVSSRSCPKDTGANSTCQAIAGRGCYCVFQILASFTEAEANCRSRGLALLSVESKSEWDAIVTFLRRALNGKDLFSNLFWTSGKFSDQWKWTANGQPVTFTNWGAGHPKISTLLLTIAAVNFAWESQPSFIGFSRQYFICES